MRVVSCGDGLVMVWWWWWLGYLGSGYKIHEMVPDNVTSLTQESHLLESFLTLSLLFFPFSCTVCGWFYFNWRVS